MNVKPIFEQNEIPTLEEYLKRCGIDDPQEYINANWVENYIVYDNIKVGVEMLRDAIVSNGKIVLVCDSDCDGCDRRCRPGCLFRGADTGGSSAASHQASGTPQPDSARGLGQHRGPRAAHSVHSGQYRQRFLTF